MDRLWTPWRYAYVTGADRTRNRPGVPDALAGFEGELPGDGRCVFCNMIAAADFAVAHGMRATEWRRPRASWSGAQVATWC